MRLQRIAAIAMCLLAAGCGEKEAEDQDHVASGPVKNLLLISIDSLRADHVGVYGYEAPFRPDLPVTPELDRFALRSVVFDQAWSSTSWTLPSHGSLFTGLDDLGHGLVNEAYVLDPSQQTLTEFLNANGYQCFGVYSGPFLKPSWGFDRGFERYESALMSSTELEGEMQKWIQAQTDSGFAEPTAEEIEAVKGYVTLWDVTSPRVNRKAKRALQQVAQSTQPFFMFLHYYDVHYDYVPGRGDKDLDSMFDPDYKGSMTGQDWHGNVAVRNPEAPYERRISERDLQHVEALYDGEVHWVDRHVGGILDELRRLKLDENTVVAIVSDHGDEFFDRGSIGHRTTLFPELNKMLFMLHIPGRFGKPMRSNQMASMMDVAPTLLEAIGLREPWLQPMGHSLLSPKPATAAKGVFSHLLVNTSRGMRLVECWRGERFTVMRPFTLDPSDDKFIRLVQRRFPDDTPAYYVYDRNQDPVELKPIPPNHPAFIHAVKKMAADFELQDQARQQVTLSDYRLRSALATTGEAEQKELHALGYADPVTAMGDEGEFLPLAPLPVPEVPQD
jgi:arylsulfatase A-like enzyme